jgi:hypothetical protein
VRRAALWGTVLVYAVSWFLPVIKDGDTLATGMLPGWQALRMSLTPIWPGEEFSGNALQDTLCVLSGLTNLVFLAGFVHLVRSQAAAPRWSWVLFGAAALNTFWLIDMSEPEDMRAGYWLWLGSFALLGLVSRLSPAAPGAAA